MTKDNITASKILLIASQVIPSIAIDFQESSNLWRLLQRAERPSYSHWLGYCCCCYSTQWRNHCCCCCSSSWIHSDTKPARSTSAKMNVTCKATTTVFYCIESYGLLILLTTLDKGSKSYWRKFWPLKTTNLHQAIIFGQDPYQAPCKYWASPTSMNFEPRIELE